MGEVVKGIYIYRRACWLFYSVAFIAGDGAFHSGLVIWEYG